MKPTKSPAILVPDSERLDFLPALTTPRYMMQFESAVFGFASQYFDGYKGGFWDFYEIPNSGFMVLHITTSLPGPRGYGTPDSPTIHLGTLPNYFDADVSLQLAGIIATSYALSDVIFQAFEDHAPDHVQNKLVTTYHALRYWALDNLSDTDQELFLRATD